MKSAWRSWFWNIVLVLCMTVLAATLTISALTQKNSLAVVGILLFSACFWAGALRAPMLGVFAKPRGVVVREFLRTTTVGWDEIDRIEMPATTPVILWRQSNGAEATLVLSALGGSRSPAAAVRRSGR
ncbi:PH domain-containing protein [Asanoa hainanensis]|uniref:PH domain-containing protein n=1 Tax=Asanoa hainanensis TaxID=560556 RepID=A0A239NX71_9ACTN|nr:PH domain-containing protein [Asanoa hainanensis]SNT58719.1 PH domain-containing protein [Asanoa hainanensis]